MKTKAVAVAAILALFLVGSLSFATAHSEMFAPKANSGTLDGGSDGEDRGNNQNVTTAQAQDNTSTTFTNHQDLGDGSDDGADNQAQVKQISVGESFNISHLSGRFESVHENSAEGVATGSLTLIVAGIFQDGVALSITSGHFTLGNTTFSVTGGNLVLGQGDNSAQGSGMAGASLFIIRLNGLLESSVSSGLVNAQVDIKNGGGEFLVSLGTLSSQGNSSGD